MLLAYQRLGARLNEVIAVFVSQHPLRAPPSFLGDLDS
jgi:hypothetical protein